jgi:4-amino-4-deoxy-L-arabinose transferase-like glycosyltransferase
MQARPPRPLAPAPPRPAAAATGAGPAARREWTVPRGLVAVLLGSLAVKLVLWAGFLAAADPALLLQGDSREYHDSARALLETGSFAVSPGLHLPQTFRTPGYPAFLAAVYGVVGARPAAALLVQIVLSVATLALVYLLVRRLWGARVALAATVLLALDVASLLLSLALLTETLFTLLLVAALACGVAVLTRLDRRRWALGMGIALAACVLVRPVAYYLVAPVALGLAVHGRRARWGARETARVLALLLVPYCAAVGGWRYRNYRATGNSAFTRVDATVLLFYRGAAIVARREGIGMDEARARLRAEFGGAPGDPVAAADPARWRREGIALIRRNPGIYARIVASGVLRSLLRPAGLRVGGAVVPEPAWTEEARRAGGSLHGVAARLARRGPLYAATFVFDALLVVAATGAAAYAVARLAAARRLSVVDVFLLGVVLYLLLVQAGATSDARGRVPIEPVLALYAARGLVELRPRPRPAASRPAPA